MRRGTALAPAPGWSRQLWQLRDEAAAPAIGRNRCRFPRSFLQRDCRCRRNTHSEPGLISEAASEPPLGDRQTRRHGSFWHVQRPRDLAIRESVKVAQHDRGRLLRGQGAQRSDQVGLSSSLGSGSFGRPRRRSTSPISWRRSRRRWVKATFRAIRYIQASAGASCFQAPQARNARR